MTHAPSEEKQENEEEFCENTGEKKSYCRCFDCTPGSFSPKDFFTSCRNIEEVLAKAYDLLDYLEFLHTGSFEVEPSNDGEWFRLLDPLVGGCYFTECQGCHYPLLLDIGDDPDNFLCKSCHDIATSRADQPKYYDDLFQYIDTMFEMLSKGGRILTENHGFTKEFCETHGFDFDAMKRRLEATGGYDDGEVMMNSVGSIPLFEELPLLLDDSEDEDNE